MVRISGWAMGVSRNDEVFPRRGEDRADVLFAVASDRADGLGAEAGCGEDLAGGVGGDRKLEAGGGAGGAISSEFVQCHQVDAQFLAGRFTMGDAAEGFEARCPGIQTLAHQFHHEKGGAVAHDVFAEAGCTGGTDLVIDIQSAADDGGVSNPAGQFATPAAGGTAGGEVAIGSEHEERDGVVVAGGWLCGCGVERFGSFGAPLGIAFSGVIFDGVETLFQGEESCAVPCEHDVRGFFHDSTGDGDRVGEALECGDASGAVGGSVEDEGIELDHAGGVGNPCEADGGIGAVGFGNMDALLDGIEQGAALVQRAKGCFVAGFSERPRGDDDRARGCGWILVTRGWSGG